MAAKRPPFLENLSGEGLEPSRLPTRPSNVRVYQFRHPDALAWFQFQASYQLKKTQGNKVGQLGKKLQSNSLCMAWLLGQVCVNQSAQNGAKMRKIYLLAT
jgi:hypothetical protein